MPTNNKTKISGTATSSNREDEHAEAQRTAAEEIKHRALERWENEGGSASDVDTVAAMLLPLTKVGR